MRFLLPILVATCLMTGPGAALADPAMRVAIHVDDNDPARMNLALNNAANIHAYYEGKGQEVEIAIVAYGPGLHMYRKDTSPVAERLSVMSLEIPGLALQGCANTLAGMTKKAGGTAPEILDEVEMVPSGAVQLIELQQQGWSYLKP